MCFHEGRFCHEDFGAVPRSAKALIFGCYHKVFGIKDPRICLLLPLYEQTCKELGIKIEYVYIERDKKSVINSIHKRDNLPKESVSKLIDGYLKYVMEKDFILASIAGIFQIGFGFILITVGSRTTPAAVVGVLMLTESVFGP